VNHIVIASAESHDALFANRFVSLYSTNQLSDPIPATKP
jgi:hypothetical protein